MFTKEQYLLGWGFYIVAAIVLLLLVWFLVRRFWRYPKHFILLSAACILFTPYYLDANSNYLAPAWLMAAMETSFSFFKTKAFDSEVFLRAGKPLLITWFSVLAAYFSFLIAWFAFGRYVSGGNNNASSVDQMAGSDSTADRVEPSLTTHYSQADAPQGEVAEPSLSEPAWQEPAPSLNLIDETVGAADSIDDVPLEPIDDSTVIKPFSARGPSDATSGEDGYEEDYQNDHQNDYNDRLENSLQLQTGLEFDIDQELDKLTNPDPSDEKLTAIQQQKKRDPKGS